MTAAHSVSSTPVLVAAVIMKVTIAASRALGLDGLVPFGVARHHSDSFDVFLLCGTFLTHEGQSGIRSIRAFTECGG